MAAALPAQAPLSSPLLNQGWGNDLRHKFWFVDQGSRIMPLAWFNKLERADSTQLFRDSLERYGFIPDDFHIAGDLNAAGLPIGFSVSVKEKEVGVNCAACHAGLIRKGSQRYMIEGAPSMLNFDLFLAELVDAMYQTIKDEGKRQRFFSGDMALQQFEFVKRLEKLSLRRLINTPDTPAGFARVDAFGHIFNQVIVEHLKNHHGKAFKPSAPASYPALWDIAQHRYVQWNHSAPNLGTGADAPGSLARNVGEVLGVFGTLEVFRQDNLFSSKWTFKTSANLENLKAIEGWLTSLRSPVWPFDQDKSMRAAGKNIYDKECSRCHATISYPLTGEYPAKRYPIAEVKTDPVLAENVRDRSAPSQILQGARVTVRSRAPFAKFGEVGKSSELLGYLSASIAREEVSLWRLFKGLLQVAWDGPQPPMVYKARPLNGVWATAPYLHNGSVPNLWELLQEPGKRISKFCVGDGVYDEKQIGFQTYVKDGVTNCPPRTSLFDTSRRGDTNVGHEYGVKLSETEKWALMEYLKSL